MSTVKSSAELIKQIKRILSKGGFSSFIMRDVQLLSVENGKCLAKFQVGKDHVNMFSGLHGGFTASLLDNITTYALMSKGSHPGVSVDLKVSYLKSAKEGDTVIVDANTVRAGKNLAYIECELRHEKDGSVIAKGGQTKFVNM
ncbi:ACOT13.2 family protein [Megaselia abdita]